MEGAVARLIVTLCAVAMEPAPVAKARATPNFKIDIIKPPGLFDGSPRLVLEDLKKLRRENPDIGDAASN
jgi:hypothetical protein